MRIVLILVLVAAAVLPLSACGRKGNPEQPDDAVYPRQYPYTPLPRPPDAKKAGDPQ